MGRLIDTDDLYKQMGEPKDYTEELIRDLINEFVDSVPTAEPSEAQTSEWTWTTYTNGFGSFKALMCAKCSTKRAQEDLSYCAHCGRRMVNAAEVGGTDVKKTADRLFHSQRLVKELVKGEWIPVSERLPEYSGLYLISIYDLVTVANFTGKHFCDRQMDKFVDVIAWQPLPEPYKEGGNKND